MIMALIHTLGEAFTTYAFNLLTDCQSLICTAGNIVSVASVDVLNSHTADRNYGTPPLGVLRRVKRVPSHSNMEDEIKLVWAVEGDYDWWRVSVIH